MAIPTQMAPGWAPFAQGQQLGMQALQNKIQNQRNMQNDVWNHYYQAQNLAMAKGLYPGKLRAQQDQHFKDLLQTDPAAAMAYADNFMKLVSGGAQQQPEQQQQQQQQQQPAQEDGKFDFDVEAAGDHPPVDGQPMSPPSPDELRGIPAVDQMMNSNNMDAQSSNPAIRDAYEHFNKLKQRYEQMRQGPSQGGAQVASQSSQAAPNGPLGKYNNLAARIAIKKGTNIDIGDESASQKRANDLTNKIAYEKQVQQDKLGLESQKQSNKKEFADYTVKVAKDKAMESGLGKIGAESYGDATKNIGILGDKQASLHRLTDVLESNPHPDQIIGPFNSWSSKYFGNPEDQKALGDIMSSSGNILMDAASGIKGAFTGRDMSFVNSMKPNANDPYFVFVGKLKAMGEATDLAKKRMEIYSENLFNKMPPHLAMQDAQKRTDFSKLNQHYSQAIKVAEDRSALQKGKMPNFSSKQEAMEFLSHLTQQEKMILRSLASGG